MGFVIRRLALALLVVLVVAARPTAQSRPEPAAPSIDGLSWRHIGPAAHGGRIDDIEAVVGRPSTIFVGAASGGIFKSTNNGVTWRPVFDDYGNSLSIGDIAIAPSDPNIVWAGSGEPNNRQSSSWGDGIYRSLDGGETWTHMGLRDTQQIGRVVIHPANPGCRVRCGARPPLGAQRGARAVPHARWRHDVAEGALRQRRHRRRRRRDRRRRPHALRRGLPEAPPRVGLRRRRSRQRPVPIP